jgi:hypothetical protein
LFVRRVRDRSVRERELHRPTRTDLPDIDDEAYLLVTGFLLGRLLLVRFDRLCVRIRMSEWSLQVRPLCGRHLQLAASAHLRGFDDAKAVCRPRHLQRRFL